MQKQAIEYADAVIQGDETLNTDIEKYIKKTGKPFLAYKNEIEYLDAFNEFYDSIFQEVDVLS